MVILGIDPGLANTGWGVVDYASGRYRPMAYGVIKTDSKRELPDRIHAIALEIRKVIDEYKPDAVSMEEIFFTKNISSAISVAKVIGAMCHECKERGLDVQIFSPPQIKSAITGIGTADKNQVQQMVKIMLGLAEIPKPDHAADALADCICYASYNSTRERISRGVKL